MTDLMDLQRRIFANKVSHGFNTTNIEMEFCLIMTELGEAYHAHALETKDAFAEELADVAIYLLGLAEIKGIDLGAAIDAKVAKNEKRVYRQLSNGHMEKVDT